MQYGVPVQGPVVMAPMMQPQVVVVQQQQAHSQEPDEPVVLHHRKAHSRRDTDGIMIMSEHKFARTCLDSCCERPSVRESEHIWVMENRVEINNAVRIAFCCLPVQHKDFTEVIYYDWEGFDDMRNVTGFCNCGGETIEFRKKIICCTCPVARLHGVEGANEIIQSIQGAKKEFTKNFGEFA